MATEDALRECDICGTATSNERCDQCEASFPSVPPEGGWPDLPYDEDGYCEFCGNGHWKLHAPWCRWADAKGL